MNKEEKKMAKKTVYEVRVSGYQVSLAKIDVVGKVNERDIWGKNCFETEEEAKQYALKLLETNLGSELDVLERTMENVKAIREMVAFYGGESN